MTAPTRTPHQPPVENVGQRARWDEIPISPDGDALPLLEDLDGQLVDAVVTRCIVGSSRANRCWSCGSPGGRKGLSIGFQGVAWEPRVTSTGGQGVKWTKIKVMEVSSVILPACPSCLLTSHKGAGCGCGGAETVVELDDEEIDLDARDVRESLRAVIPALVAAEIAQHRRRLDVVDLDDGDDFDPLANPADRLMLIESLRTTVPLLVRHEIDRLRGRISDD